MDSKKVNAEIQKHYKAIKAAAKAAHAEKKTANTAKKTKKAKKTARAEKKTAKKGADFEPVKLPAVFHSPDGFGSLTVMESAIIYSQGLREVIFPAKSAHYFARDYKAGERVIAAGSVGVKLGGKSLIFGPEAPAIVAAVRTAKAAADKATKAAKAAKAEGGAK